MGKGHTWVQGQAQPALLCALLIPQQSDGAQHDKVGGHLQSPVRLDITLRVDAGLL